MNNTFFSIIIPTYNRANMLHKAIESVLCQIFKDWELIIVDDGSTDNTKDLVFSYNNPQIKYIYQNNSERSAARNNGIINAKGKYITFLDSDDYFLPNRLENLYYEIKKRKESIAFFYTGICFEKDGVIDTKEEYPYILNLNESAKNNYLPLNLCSEANRSVKIQYNFKNIKDYLIINVIGSPQVCIHSNILKEYKYDERFSISEDFELWLRIIDAGYPFIFLNQYDIVARDHTDRSVSEIKNNSYGSMLPVLKYIFSKPHPGYDISAGIKRFVKSSIYYGIAKHYIYNHKKYKAILYLSLSILFIPLYPHTKHKIFLIWKLLITNKNKLPDIKKYIG